MRFQKKEYIVAILLMFLNVHANSQTEWVVKNKNILKSNSTDKIDELVIKNAFGNIYVHTWNKKEAKVEIAITCTANGNETALQLLDNANVQIATFDKKIQYTTHVYTPYNKGNGVRRLSEKKDTLDFEVNVTYNMYVPENLPINLDNTFGNVYIDSFSGNLTVHITHGCLHTGDLKGESIVIRNDHSIGVNTINSINSNDIKIDVPGRSIVIGKE